MDVAFILIMDFNLIMDLWIVIWLVFGLTPSKSRNFCYRNTYMTISWFLESPFVQELVDLRPSGTSVLVYCLIYDFFFQKIQRNRLSTTLNNINIVVTTLTS